MCSKLFCQENTAFYYYSMHQRKQRKKDISEENNLCIIYLSYSIFMKYVFYLVVFSHANWDKQFLK